MTQIRHSRKLSKTDAVPLVTEASLEFYRNGNTQPNIVQFEHDDEIVYAVVEREDKEDIVGFITFSHYDSWLQITLKVGYVKPAYRKHGIHTAMTRKVQEIARERGCKRIWSMVNIDNKRMHNHVLKLGRVAFGMWYCDELNLAVKENTSSEEMTIKTDVFGMVADRPWRFEEKDASRDTGNIVGKDGKVIAADVDRAYANTIIDCINAQGNPMEVL